MTTYKLIKKELFNIFEEFQHVQTKRDRYINQLYFTKEFCDIINRKLPTNKVCNCANKDEGDYNRLIKGILLSKTHREDWNKAIKRIFSENYLVYIKQNEI